MVMMNMIIWIIVYNYLWMLGDLSFRIDFSCFFFLILIINLIKVRMKYKFNIKSFNNLHKNEAKKSELNSLVS